ncbi:MAG TPA: ribonuclease P protein component [Devosiaceae bacterium]
MRRLTKRGQFLRAARGRRASGRAFTLQAVETVAPDAGLGLTVTKKTGNAPERSRIKRRLRAAAAACETAFHPQHDYVLIGRREALTEPFERLVTGIEKSIARVHSPLPDSQRTTRQ